MGAFSPKFCPTHLTIHVCDLQDITKKVASIEDDIGAKVRRLHGIQTEEEIQAEEAKRKHKPGSLGDILAKAKEKAAKEKAKINANGGITGDDALIPVPESEITDRMAALRAKMMNESTSLETSQSPSAASNTDEGLTEVIKKARKHQNDHLETEFQVPERSKMGEKDYKDLPRGNKPSAVLKDLDLDLLNETDLKESKNDSLFKEEEIIQITEPIIELDNEKEEIKVFSEEETQELIQSAVKEALKQVGLLDKNHKPKKITTPPIKKASTTGTKKQTTASSIKSTTGNKKTTTTAKTSVKKEKSTINKSKIPDLS